MKAIIIKDQTANTTVSRVGEVVEILRHGSTGKVWVRMSSGKEMQYRLNLLRSENGCIIRIKTPTTY